MPFSTTKFTPCKLCSEPVAGPRRYCNDEHKRVWHTKFGALKKWRDEHKAQISEYNRAWAAKNRPKKGRRGAPWNKGKSAKSDPRIAAQMARLAERQRIWLTTPGALETLSINNKGRKPTEAAREKMRLNARRGAANNKWKGGISDPLHGIRFGSPEYREWRASVLERDEFTCQHCGMKPEKSSNIVAHHVKPFVEFPGLRFDVSNGLTLCRACHAKIDEGIRTNPRGWGRTRFAKRKPVVAEREPCQSL